MLVAPLAFALALAAVPPLAAPPADPATAATDEAEAPPFLSWGCHGPASVGLLTGAAVGGVIAAGIGGYGTWTVNSAADSDTRNALTFASTILSSAVGIMIGGGIGAGLGLIVELIVPEAPARRVIRVTGDETGTTPVVRAAAPLP